MSAICDYNEVFSPPLWMRNCLLAKLYGRKCNFKTFDLPM